MPDDEVLQMARARIGRVLLGKDRIERVLGVGGMATVYLANHRNNKQFAVKMLHPEVSQREHLRARFLREGYVANSVKHAGAVVVLDDDVAEDGSAFLVMELLEGSPVDELWVKHDKKMPLGLRRPTGRSARRRRSPWRGPARAPRRPAPPSTGAWTPAGRSP